MAKKRPRQEKKRTPKNRFWIFFFAIVSVVCVSAFVYWHKQKDNTLDKGEPSEYTDTEQHLFYDHHLKYTLEDILGGKYLIPEINARYQERSQKITARYGKLFRVSFCTSYSKASHRVLRGCWIDGTQPVIQIFIPANMDLYQEMRGKNESDWEKKFEYTLIIGFLHELDHLAEGVPGNGKQTDEEKDLCEEIAWAATCEFTIRPLVERYHLSLEQSNDAYYQAWVEANRDRNNEKWKQFIQQTYSVTRH